MQLYEKETFLDQYANLALWLLPTMEKDVRNFQEKALRKSAVFVQNVFPRKRKTDLFCRILTGKIWLKSEGRFQQFSLGQFWCPDVFASSPQCRKKRRFAYSQTILVDFDPKKLTQ